MYLLHQEHGTPGVSALHGIRQGFAREERHMLGGYGLGVPAPRALTRNHADLERYLRLEYGGRVKVETLLPEGARVVPKAGTKGRSRGTEAVRRVTAAFPLTAAGHPHHTVTAPEGVQPRR